MVGIPRSCVGSSRLVAAAAAVSAGGGVDARDCFVFFFGGAVSSDGISARVRCFAMSFFAAMTAFDWQRS